MSIYCVYLTVYTGNTLPPFYIGSSSVARVLSGYHGTVSSKKYKTIWRHELKHNPHLFKTRIISYKRTRNAALQREKVIQQHLQAVASPLYINESYATRGVFGRVMLGKDHPLYGQPRPKEVRQKISDNHADMSGSNNTNAKTIILITPAGERIVCYGNFKEVCKQHNLAYSTMNRALNSRVFPGSGRCLGYDAVYG